MEHPLCREAEEEWIVSNTFSLYEFRKLVEHWRELMENLGNDL
jgi:hypothetical protein